MPPQRASRMVAIKFRFWLIESNKIQHLNTHQLQSVQLQVENLFKINPIATLIFGPFLSVAVEKQPLDTAEYNTRWNVKGQFKNWPPIYTNPSYDYPLSYTKSYRHAF